MRTIGLIIAALLALTGVGHADGAKIPLPREAPLQTCEEMGMRSGAMHPRVRLPNGSLSGPFFTCEPIGADACDSDGVTTVCSSPPQRPVAAKRRQSRARQ